jgi:hypothetical protein
MVTNRSIGPATYCYWLADTHSVAARQFIMHWQISTMLFYPQRLKQSSPHRQRSAKAINIGIVRSKPSGCAEATTSETECSHYNWKKKNEPRQNRTNEQHEILEVYYCGCSYPLEYRSRSQRRRHPSRLLL